MFTTGSKFFLGAATFFTLIALVYVGTSDGGLLKGGAGEIMGTWMILGLGTLLFIAGGVVVAFRDSDPAAMAQMQAMSAVDGDGVKRTSHVTPSLWPAVTAVGALVTALGLIQDKKLFLLGVCTLAVGILEWAILGWSDRASDNAEYNSNLRYGLMRAFEMPILGALVVGFIAIGFSRMLLALGPTGAVIILSVVAFVVFVVAIVVANAPTGKKVGSQIGGTLAVLGVVGVLAFWIVGVAAGEHEPKEPALNGNASASITSATLDSIDITAGGADIDSLPVPKASSVSIRLNNKSGGDVNVVVVDAAGETVISTPTLEDGEVRMLVTRLPIGGTYELRYSGAATDVTLLEVL
jgi:hypothetical protein